MEKVQNAVLYLGSFVVGCVNRKGYLHENMRERAPARTHTGIGTRVCARQGLA